MRANDPMPSIARSFDEARLLLRGAGTIDDEEERRSFVHERLRNFVQEYGNDGIKAFADILLSTDTDEVGGLALAELSRLIDPPTERYRRWLLERAVMTESPYLQYSALSGLLRIGDVDSLSILKRALQADRAGDLREKLERVISKLRRRFVGTAASKD